LPNNLIEGSGFKPGGSGAWQTKFETALQSTPVIPNVLKPKQSPSVPETLGGRNAAARSPSQLEPLESPAFSIEVSRTLDSFPALSS